MRVLAATFLLTAIAGINGTLYLPEDATECDENVEKKVYDFSMKDILENGTVSLSNHQKNVMLIVNVATYWGKTYQYHGLNALVNKYGGKGFTIVGVPCNQFGMQEPGKTHEILSGIEFVRPGKGYKPNFQLTQKTDVNDDTACPLYKYLKKACPISPQAEFSEKGRLSYRNFHASDIRWNFEKFLIGKNGKPIRRYHSRVDPHQLQADIETALRQD